MARIRFFAMALSICLLAACAPSAQALQTAVAKTQAAYTPTPTLVPTPTEKPCTDRGWADIERYFILFSIQIGTITGTSEQAFQDYLDSLKNYQAKINEVNIDACSEYARQNIITGMGNFIKGAELNITNGNLYEIATEMSEGGMMINSANQGLALLGINVSLPEIENLPNVFVW